MADRQKNQPNRNQGRKNPVKTARSASNRPTGFYILLSVLALAGIGALAYVVTKPKPEAQEVTVSNDTTNVGPSHGYSLGNPDAPVKILEFGDFECPQCGRFATLTEPDLRKRLIETGQVYFTYYDFPIRGLHKNTDAASMAAACADDQGKFWAMHDRLYDTQDQWNGEATDNPGRVVSGFASELGLNMTQWQQCYDSRKYAKRINANMAEGLRHRVNATPSFVIGNKLYAGGLGYDDMKAAVDSARARTPATATPAKQ